VNRPKTNTALCGTGRANVLHDHPFAPSGENGLFLCFQFGCRSRGIHEKCATCGWPEDEHQRALALVESGGAR